MSLKFWGVSKFQQVQLRHEFSGKDAGEHRRLILNKRPNTRVYDQVSLRKSRVNIVDACKTVHMWAELLEPGAAGRNAPGSLVDAVAEVRRYLENAKADGKAIHELVVAEHLLTTREGVRWVMPFVLSAESMEASKRRKATS